MIFAVATPDSRKSRKRKKKRTGGTSGGGIQIAFNTGIVFVHFVRNSIENTAASLFLDCHL